MDILIVDGEAFQREMVADMVAGWGHAVTVAPDAEHALDLARRRRFDLFILDVFLPDLSGMELIPLVKALQPDARIVTLTGASSRDLERRLRELGISYYMAKPFQREELQSLLEHIASRVALSRTGGGVNPAAGAAGRVPANGSRRRHRAGRCGGERKESLH